MKNIKTPLTKDVIRRLKAGDEVLLSGVIFTARDAAHKRFSDLIRRGKRVPINLKDAVIYYCGPTPSLPRRAIGSCGPTTSSRMDAFTPDLLRLGLGGMIGKGARSDEVRRAIKKYVSVYFLATGGIGALLSTKVRSARSILFKELGPEAIYKLEVKDFHLTVGIDSKGKDLYGTIGRKKK
ncbi:MAG: FumA C-terminus/TtdB family hydratase beta subunit [Candidatus Omnitrophica bacterium]|nr:FumA C-terminus/TtdB family hydratase beta subunit [Candidatus Omnitrophota bacterium]